MVSRRGFTLIELLVVISIIGLLASIVIAGVMAARDKARVSAAYVFDSTNYHVYGGDSIMHINTNSGNGVPSMDSPVGGSVNIAGNANCLTPGGYANAGCFAGYSNSGDTPSGLGYSYIFSNFTNPNSGPISYNLNPPLQLNAYAVSAWIKPTDISPSTGEWIMTMSCNTGSNPLCTNVGTTVTKLYMYSSNGSYYDTMYIGYDAGGSSWQICPSVTCNASINVPMNKWTLITVSFGGLVSTGGTGVYTVYIDGKQVVTGVPGPSSLYNNGYVDTIVVGYPAAGNVFDAAIYTHAIGK